VLAVDYVWLYADGTGPSSWEYRDTVLGDYGPHPELAAYVTDGPHPGMAALFVAG